MAFILWNPQPKDCVGKTFEEVKKFFLDEYEIRDDDGCGNFIIYDPNFKFRIYALEFENNVCVKGSTVAR